MCGCATPKACGSRFQAERRLPRDRGPPGQHVATKPVATGDQIQEASLQAHVGNLCAPHLGDPLTTESPQQRAIPPDLLTRLTESRFRINRTQSHLVQQSSHALVIDFMALSTQPGRHFPDPVERCARVLLIRASASARDALPFLAPPDTTSWIEPAPTIHTAERC